MKNRKVLNLRTHLGGLFGKTSYDSVKDKCEMELWPIGVYIKSLDNKPANILVWASNCIETRLAPEEDAAEAPKRGPGRPSGPQAA